MHFEVDRQDFRQTRVAEPPPGALTAGQIRLEVERFAFTSNNVSYAVAGDLLDYWQFFPTEAPWGRIPAIGLGTVVESANPEIEVGGRYFGYYPMADELIVEAEPRGAGRFRDVAAHRTNHAAFYVDYQEVTSDPSIEIDRIDQYLLLRAMFMTSYLVDDHLGDRNFEGAAATIVTSASSKTSISLASCLAARPDVAAIGLTSARNRDFVDGLGLYDRVITYDEGDQLDPSTRTGMVDMAGNPDVVAAVHRHLGEAIAFSVTVGATHWESRSGEPTPLPGPTPEFFFAPSQAAKKTEEWGPEELQSRMDTAYRSLVDQSEGWLRVEHRQGAAGIEATHRDLIEGRADPTSGFVCSMHTEPLG
ncbi:MAG: DUF2855 family protein [Actinomycetota bacterium]